jgi:hypothetical protein
MQVGIRESARDESRVGALGVGETLHPQCPVDGWPLAAESECLVGTPRDGDDAPDHCGCEDPVDAGFLLAGGSAKCRGREIDLLGAEREAHGLAQLVDLVFASIHERKAGLDELETIE